MYRIIFVWAPTLQLFRRLQVLRLLRTFNKSLDLTSIRGGNKWTSFRFYNVSINVTWQRIWKLLERRRGSWSKANVKIVLCSDSFYYIVNDVCVSEGSTRNVLLILLWIYNCFMKTYLTAVGGFQIFDCALCYYWFSLILYIF